MKTQAWWLVPVVSLLLGAASASTLATFKASSAYDSAESLRERVKGVEVEQKGVREDVQELKADVKEILRRLPRK